MSTIDSWQFDQVDFTYPDTGIVAAKNWNLHYRIGERWLILGATGSGKSTWAQLLIRFYDPERGQILVNGQPLAAYNLSDLRAVISYVPQDVFLFSDSIEANLRFGNPNASAADCQRVAEAVCLHEEIERFPQGYQTLVGERGVTLSGGQKQRLSLARALLKPAQLYVLDDCLSAVDVQTEQRILKALDQLTAEAGLVLITHRIPQDFTFDWAVYMQQGLIVEQGIPTDLEKKEGAYARQLTGKSAG